jgi:hypothetical protein
LQLLVSLVILHLRAICDRTYLESGTPSMSASDDNNVKNVGSTGSLFSFLSRYGMHVNAST